MGKLIRRFVVMLSPVLVGAGFATHSQAESSLSSGTDALSASASIIIRIEIPEQLSVNLPASGDPHGPIASSYRLNTGSLSVTKTTGRRFQLCGVGQATSSQVRSPPRPTPSPVPKRTMR